MLLYWTKSRHATGTVWTISRRVINWLFILTVCIKIEKTFNEAKTTPYDIVSNELTSVIDGIVLIWVLNYKIHNMQNFVIIIFKIKFSNVFFFNL